MHEKDHSYDFHPYIHKQCLSHGYLQLFDETESGYNMQAMFFHSLNKNRGTTYVHYRDCIEKR